MKEQYPYRVRFTKDGEVVFTATVTAINEKEAIVMAKIRASMAGVIIFETKVEVL